MPEKNYVKDNKENTYQLYEFNVPWKFLDDIERDFPEW